MRFPWLVTHRGRTSRGVEVVSDGMIVLLSRLLASTAVAPRCLDVTIASVDALLDAPLATWHPLSALRPSARRAGVFWTPDGVAIAGPHVSLLHELGAVLLGTGDRLAPVRLRLDDEIIGALMPLDIPPESEPLPPPAPGVARGHLYGMGREPGVGQVRLDDGRDARLDVRCSLEPFHNGDLVDVDLAEGPDHEPVVVRLWHAGQPPPGSDPGRRRPPPGLPLEPLRTAPPLAPPLPREGPRSSLATRPPTALAPAPGRQPPELVPQKGGDMVMHLERFDLESRRLIAAAQRLADTQLHVNFEPLHLAIELVKATVDPSRSRHALRLGEQAMARLPRQQAGTSSMSLVMIDVLTAADQKAAGRPVTRHDLWSEILGRRGLSGSVVLSATMD